MGEDFSEHDELNSLLEEPERDVYVVYPGEGSVPISTVAATVNKQRIQTVILLDGTWKKAYKMWQLATNLHHLPLVNLDNADNGNYRIRKSPKDQGVSTVEAGYLALSAFEADTDKFTPLLTTFNHMIDFQIKQMPQGVFEKNYL